MSRVVDGDLNVSVVGFAADATGAGRRRNGYLLGIRNGRYSDGFRRRRRDRVGKLPVEGGKTVTFTAAADSGYTVNTWSGRCFGFLRHGDGPG